MLRGEVRKERPRALRLMRLSQYIDGTLTKRSTAEAMFIPDVGCICLNLITHILCGEVRHCTIVCTTPDDGSPSLFYAMCPESCRSAQITESYNSADVCTCSIQGASRRSVIQSIYCNPVPVSLLIVMFIEINKWNYLYFQVYSFVITLWLVLNSVFHHNLTDFSGPSVQPCSTSFILIHCSGGVKLALGLLCNGIVWITADAVGIHSFLHKFSKKLERSAPQMSSERRLWWKFTAFSEL